MKHKEFIKPTSLVRFPEINRIYNPFAPNWNRSFNKINCQNRGRSENIDIVNLIDFSQLNTIFRHFSEVMGVSVNIIDFDARILASSSWLPRDTPSDWKSTTNFLNCFDCYCYLAKRVRETKTFALHRNQNGLTDCASPIMVEGQHIANILICQFIFENSELNPHQNKQDKPDVIDKQYAKNINSEAVIINEKKLASMLNLIAGMAEQTATQSLAEWRNAGGYTKTERQTISQPVESEASRELLKQVSSQIPGIVYQFRARLDGMASLPLANNRISDIFQHPPEGAFNDASKIVNMVHSDDKAEFLTSIKKSAVSGKAWRHRFRICLPDGKYRWLFGNSVPKRELDGCFLWHGFITDITNELASAEKTQLAASVFISSQDGIMFVDANMKLIDANPAFTKITGYSHDQAIGKPIKSFASLGPENKELYEEILQVLARYDSWKGDIWLKRQTGEVFPARLSIDPVPHKNGLLQRYVAVFSDISQLKAHEAELERIAYYDNLTGSANRHLLGDRLLQAMARINRTDKFLAVCFFDLDGFKPVNDLFGHAAGDQLLITLTNRLQKVLRANDTLARIGGDEFVLLFSDLTKIQELEQVLDRTMTVISSPVIIDDTRISVTASVGVTLYPTDNSTADILLQHADQAMYCAKSAGKNCYHLFDSKTETSRYNLRLHLEKVTSAFYNDEFVLQYQPKVNMATGRVFGVEALLRWQSPEQGIVQPESFLSLISGQDLEIVVGEWILLTVLEQIKQWQDLGIYLSVSVNISTNHLLRDNFPDRLSMILASYPTLKPCYLELEILESVTFNDLEFASRILSRCQELGVRFALDNFGSGYSSLTYYRNLPVDALKIDHVFVQGMLDESENHSIVESVVRLSQAFNRQVVADGVETMAHAAELVQLGCNLMQGLGIAKPMFSKELPSWLMEWKKAASWKNLHNLNNTSDLTLNPAAESYRKWKEQLTRYLSYSESAIDSDLKNNHILFEQWYSDKILEPHASERNAQPITTFHELLQHLVSDLMDISQTEDAQDLQTSIPNFNRTYSELLAKLDVLIQGSHSTYTGKRR